MMSTDNVYGTFCAEPSAEEAWEENVLIEPPYDQEYEYLELDGYER